MNDEERLAYYIRTANQEGKRAADLQRQLDTAWGHINDLGEMLRQNGLDAGTLTAHIDHMAEISAAGAIQVDAYDQFRTAIVMDFHEAEDGVKKGRSKADAFDWIMKRFLQRNRKVMDAGTMEEARKVVAESRAQKTALAQTSLFEIAS